MRNKVIESLRSFYKKYISKYNRKPSYPYVSGDTFRKSCNHIYDEFTKLDPKKVSEGQFIFVKTDYIIKFFSEIHPEIDCRYNLLTHNSDMSITADLEKYIDNKIIKWYGQNIFDKFSNKLEVIPIGIENHWHLKNGRIKNFNKVLNKLPKKTILIHCSFNVENHVSRNKVLDIAKEMKSVTINSTKNNLEYLNILASSKFNICPEGNGLDSHRIWESFIFESIPIVEENSFTLQLKELGLPMLYLKNWSDLKKLPTDELIKIYSEVTTNHELKLFSQFDYWEKITNLK